MLRGLLGFVACLRMGAVNGNLMRCAFALATVIAGTTTVVGIQVGDQALSFYNVNTKETLSVVYKRNGAYIPSAMKQINHMLRDWRRNETITMDPNLIDLIWELHTELGSQKPIHVISGYRSRRTNNSLRRTKGGQAKNSRHILGKATDLHFPDISAKQLRNSAMIRERGGVGYYPTSAIPFVHVDTGRVRHWPRMRRLDIAALFPDGKSKHRPRGGGPITKRDHTRAMAKLSKAQKHLLQVAHGHIHHDKPPYALMQVARLEAEAGSGGAVFQTASLTPSRAAPPPLPNEGLVAQNQARLILASADPMADLINRNMDVVADGGVPAPSGWARAPAYDDEHPDELFYRPFPILPLMGAKSISHDENLASLSHPDYTKIVALMGEAEDIPLRFRPGLQFAEMLWASEFKGLAVPSLLTGDTYVASKKPKRKRRVASKKRRRKSVSKKRRRKRRTRTAKK